MVFDSKNMISSLYFPYQPLGKIRGNQYIFQNDGTKFSTRKKKFDDFLYVIAADEISLIPKFY